MGGILMCEYKEDRYQKLRNVMNDILLNNTEVTNKPNKYVFDFSLEPYTNELKEQINAKEKFLLYRYSVADYNNLRNLEKGRLYLTPIGNLNDIFEGIPNTEGNLETISERDLRGIRELAFLKCFSEDKNNVLMWSHYTGESKGFCLEYDLSLLETDDQYLNTSFRSHM